MLLGTVEAETGDFFKQEQGCPWGHVRLRMSLRPARRRAPVLQKKKEKEKITS